VLLRALNLPALWRHARRRPRDVWDPADDLELRLYRSIAGVDYLHYGYFDPIPSDPADISLADVQRAMGRYAELFTARVAPGERVLDVGCGTGGLLGKLAQAGAKPTGLTPNRAHAGYIRERYPGIEVIHSRLEDLDADALAGGFDVVANAESLQYIDLAAAFRSVFALLSPGGRWVLTDYFRLRESTRNRSGHLLERFEDALRESPFTARERLDMTDNVLPTLAFAHTLASRIALPLAEFAAERFLARHAVWNYLAGDLARNAIGKIKLDGVDPAVFRRDKRYMLFVLVKE
jgi:MPBQ/MSBQ methyltransferase